MFQVINGKASPNLFEGIEEAGVMRLAKTLIEFIKNDTGRELNLSEAKEVLDTKRLKIRNQVTDYSDQIRMFKVEYLKELTELVEQKYGKILDKMDCMYLVGGGSHIFRDSTDSFIKVPQHDNEYYNTIGFYLYALAKS